MAPHAKHRAPRTGARWRLLVGAALSGALVVGLLVGPELRWWDAARPPVPVAQAADPVTWPLREGPPVPPVRPVDATTVLRGVDAAAGAVAGSVAAVVVDPFGRVLLATPDADRPLPSASLVKLLVVQQLLARTSPAGWDAITLRRMERAITVSDDGAMSFLWGAYDGPALVQAAVAQFGLTGTGPPAEVGQWGEATTTASDVARFLSALAASETAADSATLLGWMRALAPTAVDGFDQTFGLLSGVAGAGVAAKQGWMCCVDGRRQVHSVGLLADGRVVVVLGDAPAGTTWARVIAAVDAATEVLVAGTG